MHICVVIRFSHSGFHGQIQKNFDHLAGKFRTDPSFFFKCLFSIKIHEFHDKTLLLIIFRHFCQIVC